MPSESRRLQARGSAAAAMRALHVFAPSSEEIYVIATSLSDPCLVIDRRTGLCRVAPPAELVSLIGPAGNRARSIPLQAVVGIVSFPDDKALITTITSRSKAHYEPVFSCVRGEHSFSRVLVSLPRSSLYDRFIEVKPVENLPHVHTKIRRLRTRART